MDGAQSHHQELVVCQDELDHSMVIDQGDEPPLSRFPVEVLCQIFVSCLPAETHNFRVSPDLAPLLLTRICRRWREIAVNTPSLWCRLYVRPDKDWPKAAPHYDLWLQRSRGRPLSLAVDCSPKGATKLQRLLRPYKTQVSSLQLLSEDASTAAGLCLQDFSALKQLKIQWQGKHSNETDVA
jgi:hypothetical protein